MSNKCPDCNGPLMLLTSQELKICYDCRMEWNWSLDEGQLPLVSNNRLKNRLQSNETIGRHVHGVKNAPLENKRS